MAMETNFKGLPDQHLPPLGNLDGARDFYPSHFTCTRNGLWPRDEVIQAMLWARGCADAADDFRRFLRLLKTDYGLDDWVAATPRGELRRIWSAPPYRRPRIWQDTIIGVDGCALERWVWLCSQLRQCDGVFHEIPNSEETAYCVALDLLRWDGMGRRGAAPDISALADDAERIIRAADDLRNRWPDWRGRPWRIVAHARRESFAAWEREWPLRRAGERFEFTPPTLPVGSAATPLVFRGLKQ